MTRRDIDAENATRESGNPGVGGGRKDEVGRSGVYPASGPYPEGNAEFRGQASWGQGERGAAGYEDHGDSELVYQSGELLGAYKREDHPTQQFSVDIPADRVILKGDLHIPGEVRGLVLFAHGSGSSRHSPRNQFVARVLQEAGLATLLFDLLTEPEEQIDGTTARLRFDIDFLAGRLVHATRWIRGEGGLGKLRLGYFGASTGAAAALVAATQVNEIASVVSRGGRPDLAGTALSQVHAPVLLIVGGEDYDVVELNKQAAARLQEKKLEIIPGATHLFEEPGALEQVAQMARHWFLRTLEGRDVAIRAA